jgi:hypothetical protein
MFAAGVLLINPVNFYPESSEELRVPQMLCQDSYGKQFLDFVTVFLPKCKLLF